MSKLDEMILVSPRSRVFGDEAYAFHGFLPLTDARAERILSGLCERPHLARRGDVEEDPSLLQPIPYVVVTRRLAGALELFAYTRLSGGGEKRLHGRMSIGVGGHMNHVFDDSSLRLVIDQEAARELEEEIICRDASGREASPPPARLLGLINDDTGEVQRVHIGILAVVELPAGWRVEVREKERLEGRWIGEEELASDAAPRNLEEWSIHALAALHSGMLLDAGSAPREGR